MELLKSYDPYTVRRNIPENFSEEDRALFHHELERQFDGFRIVSYCSVWIDSGGLVAKKFSLVEKESLVNLRIGKHESFKWVKQSAKLHAKKRKAHVEKAIWITERWSHGYFHWFCDALTRYFILPEKKLDYIIILPAHYAEFSYIKASLAYLDLKHFFVSRGEKIFAENLIMAEPTSKTGNYFPEAIRKVSSALKFSANPELSNKRFYISRNKAKIRQLLNETECLPILEKHGFSLVYLEDYSFTDQMELMATAEAIIGVHGAGFTNLLACPRGTITIEIRGVNDNKNNCFFSLASALDSPYYYIKASENPTASDCVGNVFLDPAILDNALKQIFPEK
ncbi:MAG: capsular polysaccharide biosynthesis protein [Cryomorphaceae bacterium]